MPSSACQTAKPSPFALRATRRLTGLPLAPLSIDSAVPTTRGTADRGGCVASGAAAGVGGIALAAADSAGGIELGGSSPPPPQPLTHSNSETMQPACTIAAGAAE